MNRHDNTRVETEALAARVRDLIARSSLGEEAPRLLRRRTRPDQVAQVRRLLWQLETTPGAGTLDETVSGHSLEPTGMVDLPNRRPGRWMSTSGGRQAAQVSYADPAYRSLYRNDSATMTRVAAGLRRLESCST